MGLVGSGWEQGLAKMKEKNDVGAGGEAGSGQERDRILLVDLYITVK